jgi:DNA-binding GntR family transcriptional regulator
LITLDRHRGGVVRELNWDDMEEINRIRQQLDPLAIPLAVRGITDQQLDEAERLCDLMADEEELATWVDLNRKFHALFYAATRSQRLEAILSGLEESATAYVAQAQRSHPEIRRRANAAHRELVAAARRRDEATALAAMDGHVGLSLELTDPAERGRPDPETSAASPGG